MRYDEFGLVVELDDRSHHNRQAEDARRDAMLAQAGYPTLRVPVRQTYNVKDLTLKIRMALDQR